MRNIKFRGKSKLTGEWLYGSLINNVFCSADGDICYLVDHNKLDYDCWGDIAEQIDDFEVVNETIGQYTGENDINGNEIYEGDILYWEPMLISNIEPLKGVVKFIEGAWWIINEEEKRGVQLWSEADYLKIKGNAHQNPDMLI